MPQRNPLYAAKAVTTLDRLSRGRLDFGIGVGWSRAEFDALGVPWALRGQRCDEHLEVMHTLSVDDISSFEGRHYRLPPRRQLPKPVQRPHPPILVGGNGEPALRRVARRGDGWFALDRTPLQLKAGISKLNRFLEDTKRLREQGPAIVAAVHEERYSDIDANEYRLHGANELVVLACATGRDDTLTLLDRLEQRFLTR